MSSFASYIERQDWLPTLDRANYSQPSISLDASVRMLDPYTNEEFDRLIVAAIIHTLTLEEFIKLKRGYAYYDPDDGINYGYDPGNWPSYEFELVRYFERRVRVPTGNEVSFGDPEAPQQPEPEPVPPRRFLSAFRKELHELLCSDDKDSEAKRDSILKESNIGQSSVALTIAAMIAPALGTSAGMIAGAVTVALAIIGRVGLSAWCATQSS